jgi:multisubunit Na+/H+ antiporter MnhE subunit
VGWSELGLWGITKSALGSGLFSAGFDLSTSYLLTGHISWRSVLAAFLVGAASGAFGRVVLKGMRGSSKIAGFIAGASERVGPARLLEGIFAEVREGSGFATLLTVGKDFTVTLGKKFAYALTSGLIGTATNAMFCLVSGKPITLSGSLAGFIAGAIMGTIAMTFGYKGIRGALDRLIKFDSQLVKSLKYTISKILSKTIHKWLTNYLKKLFSRVTKEGST